MEEFFDRSGPWGRVMMCSTASVQVCVDAGQEQGGPAGFRWRWHLLHGLSPVLVASFANSPFQDGRVSGWKLTRQAVWSRLDPSRTRAPEEVEPGAADHGPAWPEDTDPRDAWVSYVLDAQVMVLRDPGSPRWIAPSGLTFRDWVRGAVGPPPTADDLTYHMSTLFPPVRPRGHLELRVIDAQLGDGWIVPTAVVSALLDDPVAAQAAMAAVEPLQKEGPPGELLVRAARLGQDDPALARPAGNASPRPTRRSPGSTPRPRSGTRSPRSPTVTCCAAGVPRTTGWTRPASRSASRPAPVTLTHVWRSPHDAHACHPRLAPPGRRPGAGRPAG